MKRFTMTMVLLLMAATLGIAQNADYRKIAPDLIEEVDGSSRFDEMFKVIIVLNNQFDAQKSVQQMQHLGKAQQRKLVMEELQRTSKIKQTDILKDLQQGQKAALVDDIQSFWIINAISCSMTKDMIFAIAERPDVRFVMKDTEIHVADGEVSESAQANRSKNQWNVTKVNADDVWEMGYTGQGIVVAVIDTGVNYNHTDIAANMWDGGTEYPNHGWDFANKDNDPMDDVDHGTHCAGTVSSYGTNGKQCGIAKDAKIMALKSLVPKDNGGGTGLRSDTWAAIEFAVSHGADILSMSLGSSSYGSYWAYRAIMENVLHCGVVAAVSAGNEGNDLSTYPIPSNIGSPGNCPSPWQHPDQTLEGGHSAVVTVGATDSIDSHSSFSSIGPSTWASGNYIGYYEDYPFTEGDPTNIGLIKPDISAPGSGIISLSHTSNTGYRSMNGTSMAAPCVAGVMALMLSANPTLTPVEIDSIIETTAVACGGQTSKNNTFGAGRIDALAAINYMLNACEAPTNLIATATGANVTLNWDAASGVSTYRVYRNGAMIAKNVSGTSYIDENVPSGDNTYYIKSNGENYHASMPSNQVTVNITTNVEINAPSHFELSSINENEATLCWEAPTAREKTIFYSDEEAVTEENKSYYGYNRNEFTAGQRFQSSLLQQYNGMQIEHIYFSVHNSDVANVECTIKLYEGDAMQPGLLVHSGTITSTEAEQSMDYTVNPPIFINSSKELWLTVTMSDRLLIEKGYESNGNGDAFMVHLPTDSYWYSNLGYSWMFKIGIRDGNFGYNIYRNGQIVSSNQSASTYAIELGDGMNDFHVRTVLNGYESNKSNSIKIVKGSNTQQEIALCEEDNLVVLPNGILTVTGNLSNANEDNLIIENGAQLIHNSENVKATVKKSIASHNNGSGWNFIASPVAEEITPSESNGFLNGDYDLYYYNEPTHFWRNFKGEQDGNHADPGFKINYRQGYLYANGETKGTTLYFSGTLAPSNESITIDNLSHEAENLQGFNLVGNPFACNATIDQDCYVIDNGRVVLASGTKVFSPCEGAFVKATEENQYQVTFTKANNTRSKRDSQSIDLVVSQGRAALDRARVRFGEGVGLEKFNLDNDESTQLTLWQNGQDYAVAYANISTDVARNVSTNEMPVNFKAVENGTYSIGVEANNLDLDYLHLIDNMTGADIDLLTMPQYTFEAKTSDYASRFRLVFSNCGDAIGDIDTLAYYADGAIRIAADACDASLQVVDVTGRVIVSTDVERNVSTSGMTPGVYVLRLIDGENVRTQKIVIK